jgi:hypothetical protein
MMSCGVQSQQLLAESQIFKDEFLTGTEGGNNPAGQMPEEGDHAPKSYRNRRQCSVHSGRKLFISRERKVLMSHNRALISMFRGNNANVVLQVEIAGRLVPCYSLTWVPPLVRIHLEEDENSHASN